MNNAKLRYMTLITAWKGNRTENEAAADLGVAPNTLGNWTDGTHLPPTTRLPSLATLLGMPLDDLRALVAKDRRARSRRLRAIGVRSAARGVHDKKHTTGGVA